MVPIALAITVSLTGCRGNLFAPDASSDGSTPDGARMVQPYLLVLGPDGEPLSRAGIRIDSSLYRSGARGISYQHSGPVSRLPEAVEAPFSIEVTLTSLPRREHLVLDVYPAEAETLVLKWPPPNLEVHLEWPASFSDDEVEISSADLSVRIDSRSAHLPAAEVRTRWWNTRTQLTEGRTLLFFLPATADSVESLNASWRLAATDSSPVLSFDATVPAFAFPATTEVTVEATFGPMPVRVVWGGGAFELEQFDLTTSITRPDGVIERVNIRPRRGMGDATRWGWPGNMDVSLAPFDQHAVFPWREFVQWNGVDEVVIELGRHAFTTRAVNAAGEPFRFVTLVLEPLLPSVGGIEQTAGLDGRITWYVNDGDYTLGFAGEYSSDSPRGGPWRVEGDLSVTWEVP